MNATSSDEFGFEEFTFASTLDGANEKALLLQPKKKEGRYPLVIGLHTWSEDRFNQREQMSPFCIERGWALLLPEFRGPNLTTNPRAKEAGGSRLARQDIVDAADHVLKAHSAIDPANVLILGGSGGGHMALLMAAYVPSRWRAVSSWCPITDLAAWHAENADYSAHIEAVCGGRPGSTPEVDANYRNRSPIHYRSQLASANLSVHHGRFDAGVPFTHTLRLARALEKIGAGRFFVEIFDGGHELRGQVAFRWFDRLVSSSSGRAQLTG